MVITLGGYRAGRLHLSMGLRICFSPEISFLTVFVFLVFLPTRHAYFIWATKRAEMQVATKPSLCIIFLNKEHRSSNTSVSVTTIKPLNTKNSF